MKALVIILAILVILAFLPIKCCARYLGAPQVDLRVGPLRFALYPGKEKPRKKPKEKAKQPKQKPKKEQPAQQKKSFTPEAVLQYVPLVQTALQTLSRLCRSIAVRLKLHVTYGAEDPADAAVRYGQAWVIIGAVIPVLETAFHIKKRDVQAVFDPNEHGFSLETELTARLLLWQIIAIAVSAGVKLLLQFLKIRKGGASK